MQMDDDYEPGDSQCLKRLRRNGTPVLRSKRTRDDTSSSRPPSRRRLTRLASSSASERKDTKGVLQIAIDVGTTSSSVSFRLGFDGEICDVIFVGDDNDPHLSPAIFWYDEEGSLVCGHELESILRDSNRIPHDQVIRQAKLAAFDHPHTADIRRKTIKQLQRSNKTLTNLFSDLYSYLLSRTKEFIAMTTGTEVEALDVMKIEVFSSSPQLFNPANNFPLINAAKAIHAQSAQVVSEPICLATALFFSDNKLWTGTPFTKAREVGDVFLFCDLGGGKSRWRLRNLAQLQILLTDRLLEVSPALQSSKSRKHLVTARNLPCRCSCQLFTSRAERLWSTQASKTT